MDISSHDKKELKQQQRELEQQQRDAQKQSHTSKRRMLHIGIGAFIVLVAVIGMSAYVRSSGPYDDFAKCLAEKAEIYGADFCKYTAEQMGMFGKSYKYLSYHDFKERNDIKITPTWIVNGEKYERVQSFERLSELTGCKL